MDFEKRIDKLTERHEALTQSVEMLTQDVREMQAAMSTVREGIEGLLRIAELQHDRITRLEGGAA